MSGAGPAYVAVQWQAMANQSNRDNPEILLGVLSAVERDSDVTQRSISSELGIALGLANAYVGRCVRKGLIKVRQVPLNRYAYYLTPHGFAEKSRLTAEYLTVSLDFFRTARRECSQLISECDDAGYRRLALAGAGELAEIATLSTTDGTAEVICVVEPKSNSGEICAGRPVFASLAQATEWAKPRGGIDAVVITDVMAPQATYDSIVEEAASFGLGRGRVLTPALLRITRVQRQPVDLLL
jgi:DNA-binding MarR family transcriptional regulator